MSMDLSLDPANIASGKDQTTVLSISLQDELPESMFPLEFYIEDTNRTLNPTGTDGHGKSIDVPVKLGTSLFNSSNKESYYYVRTVNHSEYERIYAAAKAATPEGQPVVYSFDTEFKTIEEASATTIWVDNDYFSPESVDLGNHPSFVSPSTQTVSSSATSATVNVDVASGVAWTATVEGGATFGENRPRNSIATKADSGNTASGSGPAVLTVVFDANETDNNITYKVTVTAGGVDEVSKIIQRRQPQTYNVSFSDFTVEDGTDEVKNPDESVTIKLENATQNDDSITMGYRSGRNNYNGKITVTSGTNITGITVTYLDSNNAGYDSNPSSSPSGYSKSGVVGSWTGSAKTVTINNSNTRGSGNNYNFPRITGITVTYE